MVLIGLAGPDGSGKSSVAKTLAALHYGKVLSFAGPLKAMMRVLLGQLYLPADVDHMLNGNMKNHEMAFADGKTPRDLMRSLGTEWGRRMVADDLWITIAASNIDYWKERPIVIFDDVRFENEANLIKNEGGFLFEITRPGVEYSDAHVSDSRIAVGMPKIINSSPDAAAQAISDWIKQNV